MCADRVVAHRQAPGEACFLTFETLNPESRGFVGERRQLAAGELSKS